MVDILSINNEKGLRGYSDNYLKGAKKQLLSYEGDFFSPLKLFGFKLAIIMFSDFGLISSNDRSLFTSKVFQGYGVGFRIKNEHLIFPAFQFMFGYYPNIYQADGVHYALFHEGAAYYQFNKFQFSSPATVSGQMKSGIGLTTYSSFRAIPPRAIRRYILPSPSVGGSAACRIISIHKRRRNCMNTL